jgi:hypothetical protein
MVGVCGNLPFGMAPGAFFFLFIVAVEDGSTV